MKTRTLISAARSAPAANTRRHRTPPPRACRLPALCAAALFIATSLHASEAPILDLAVSGGVVEDKSSFQRQITFNRTEPMNGDKEMLLPNLDALVIEYAEGDPLFGTEAFTFMIRCKFGRLEPYPEKPYFFVGRWDILSDGRVIGLSFNESGAGLTFALSQFGNITTEKSLAGVSLPELPADTWVVVVGQYDPGNVLKVKLYDADGEMLASEKSKYIPPSLHKCTTPFKVGSMPDVQMVIGQVRAWNRCLDDGEVQDEVEALTK